MRTSKKPSSPARASKPVVRYRECMENQVYKGNCAIIMPIDHPSDDVSNSGMPAITSRIIQSYDDGVFETENTIYKPEGGII